MPEDRKTPLLDRLEKGPWPSFVTGNEKGCRQEPIC